MKKCIRRVLSFWICPIFFSAAFLSSFSEAPILEKPDDYAFKLELSVPETVSSGSDFTAILTIRSVGAGIDSSSLQSLTADLVCNDAHFTCAEGKTLSFLFPAESPLSEYAVELHFSAKEFTAKEENERFYLALDHASVTLKSGKTIPGIGAIAYLTAEPCDDPSAPPPELSSEGEYSEESIENSSPEESSETPQNRLDDFCQANHYQIRSGFLYGLSPQTSVFSLRDSYPFLKIKSSAGVEKVTGFLGTGMWICFDEIKVSCVCIGDINGDGLITAVDYIYTRQNLLGGLPFNDAQKIASDTDGDSRFTARDYLSIRFYLLGVLPTLS